MTGRACREPPQGGDHGLDLEPPGGRLIGVPRRRWRKAHLSQQAARFELLEALAEDIGTDPRQALPEVGKAAGPEQQLPHDQQRPAIADQLKPMRGAARIAVTPPRLA